MKKSHVLYLVISLCVISIITIPWFSTPKFVNGPQDQLQKYDYVSYDNNDHQTFHSTLVYSGFGYVVHTGFEDTVIYDDESYELKTIPNDNLNVIGKGRFYHIININYGFNFMDVVIMFLILVILFSIYLLSVIKKHKNE
jgi:hypothetical protein